ncbi:MAG: hypothetical protein M1819_001166 [Sarea resinae]|nr:MAG: hypothetical protein M1819_001166 [Sarea resinae]
MPRKAFLNDLEQVSHEVEAPRISNVRPADEDGTFNFDYELSDGRQVTIQALVSDVCEYPSQHRIFLYTVSDDVPAQVSKALGDLGSLTAITIPQLLSKLSGALSPAAESRPLSTGDSDALGDEDDHPESALDVDDDHPESAMDVDDDDEESWSQSSSEGHVPYFPPSSLQASTRAALNLRIRSDLLAAKSAGFKVGCLGRVMGGDDAFIVSVSCRTAKLGISDECLEAWSLDKHDYLILLIRYTSAYQTTEQLTSREHYRNQSGVDLRVGVSDNYKPSPIEASSAFGAVITENGAEDAQDLSEKGANGPLKDIPRASFRHIFIGRPLTDLLNTRFLSVVRYRIASDLGWDAAELLDSRVREGKGNKAGDLLTNSIEDKPKMSLPLIARADHLSEGEKHASSDRSFPLIAMQFLLRHFVRCTEFCVVCHSKVGEKFEALKPYVCSKPLCLYQYMNLGFGPSIEYEIWSQPYVVDLLISFGYTSALAGRLQQLPLGMHLKIPPPTGAMSDKTLKSSSHSASYDSSAPELVFSSESTRCPIKPGDWIVLSLSGPPKAELHCRVEDTASYPKIKLGPPVKIGETVGNAETLGQAPPQPSRTPLLPTGKLNDGTFKIYDTDFDEVSTEHKQQSICTLLDTLPSVLEMKKYLEQGRATNATLAGWTERISPAALGVLRWIIASNRSCIMQVDSLDEEGKAVVCSRMNQRIRGVDGWMQFRFAQGAPDKEQRFVNSIEEATKRLDLPYPTIFAWHGSPLANWHGIIREGLHFKETQHGRSYGHGVYHSLDFRTSEGYAASIVVNTTTHPNSWPQSHLKACNAMSLNEIVNAPQEFVSTSPHLVVSQLDWIQTRYLFVKRRDSTKQTKEVNTATAEAFKQDPRLTPTGNAGRIVVPIFAVSKSRRPAISSVKRGDKKQKIVVDVTSDDDAASVKTFAEDLEILSTSFEHQKMVSANSNGRMVAKDDSLTEFVPGTLDVSSLPLLDPPSYATSSTTRTLQRHLQAVLKVQESQPLQELGWYIDAEKVTNMYQWIVELHSINKTLPLAQDMKAQGLSSIVLELRFGKDFPISPPFVRIIRPRFLSFVSGGGGHVTAGGALCMELLTNTGWSAVSSIESVLLQVRLAILEPERPARLESPNKQSRSRDYRTGEAMDAYRRACQNHGWEIPKEFAEFAESKEDEGAKPAATSVASGSTKGPRR